VIRRAREKISPVDLIEMRIIFVSSKRVVTGTLIYKIPCLENIKDALASRGALILLESGWLSPRRELNYRSEIFVDVVFSEIGGCDFPDIKVRDKNCSKRTGYSLVLMSSSRQAATTG